MPKRPYPVDDIMDSEVFISDIDDQESFVLRKLVIPIATLDDISNLSDVDKGHLKNVVGSVKGKFNCNGNLIIENNEQAAKIAEALANEAHASFFMFDMPNDFLYEYYTIEKKIDTLFEIAQMRRPAVVFFNHLDAAISKTILRKSFPAREIKKALLSQFETMGDSYEREILLVGAMQNATDLDESMNLGFKMVVNAYEKNIQGT